MAEALPRPNHITNLAKVLLKPFDGLVNTFIEFVMWSYDLDNTSTKFLKWSDRLGNVSAKLIAWSAGLGNISTKFIMWSPTTIL